MRRHRRVLAGLGPLGLMFGCSAPAPTAHRGSTTTSANPQADAGPDATAVPSAATSTGLATSSAAVGSPSATAVDPPTTTVTFTVPTTPRTTTTFAIPVPTTATTTLPENVDNGLTDEDWVGACGGPLPPCWVMRAESGGDLRVWNGGCYYPAGYAGSNPCGSTASGKWQFLRSTWAWFRGFRNAADAPESVQDEAARALWDSGRGCSHWGAC